MVNTLKETRKNLGRVHSHVYRPRGGCKEVIEAREDEVLIAGPAGTGKSRACLEKLFTICITNPDVRILIARKTARSLGSTTLVTWRNYVVKEAMLTGTVVYYGGSQQEAPQYRFKNGSTVTIGGLDNPTRIMSSDYDVIYIPEATEITKEDHEMCMTRLRNGAITFQQLMMDANPAGENHWLKQRCNDGLCHLITSVHEDNPVLFDDAGVMTKRGEKYMSILDKLTGVRHKRLRLGLWVSAEGVIYEEFDRSTHVLSWDYDPDTGERLPLPAEWTRYWAIDFGYRNPFVLKCYAEGPDGELYMYREIYHTERTVAEHAITIMDIVAPFKTEKWYDHFNKVERSRTYREWIEPMPSMVICDHDAEGRRTFEIETGLGTQPAIKNVYEGINAVKERFKHDGLFYMEDSLVEMDQDLKNKMWPTCTIEEHPGYVWKISTDGRMLDEPVKKDDHGEDTDRYIVEKLDLIGKARATKL